MYRSRTNKMVHRRVKKVNKEVNARFIILDPNDEYSEAFDNLGKVKNLL